MTRHILFGACIAGSVLALSACDEREVILPGLRETPDTILQSDTPVPVDPSKPQNLSQPISLASASAAADWPAWPVSEIGRNPHPALGAAPALAWSANIGQGDSRRYRITANPVVSGGRIFTLDSHAQVTATGTGGETLWTHDLTPTRDRVGDAAGGGLTIGGGTLFVSSGFGKLTALDPATGAEKWVQELDATGNGTPTYADGLVYLVAGDRTAWAIEAETGRIRWQLDSVEDVNNVQGGPAPAVTDRYVIFSYGSGELQAAFRQGGLSIWNAAIVGGRPGRALAQVEDITGDPVVVGDRVIVGNQSGRLVALGRDNGERLWTIEEGLQGPAWPAGGSLFVVSDENELLRISAADGSRIWGVDLPNFTRPSASARRRGEIFAHYGPVVAGGRVLVAGSDGWLRQYDPRDGSLIGQVDIPGGASSAPVVAGGVMYIVNARGQLLAYR
ncbi:PQQ-like beta-propeller repeat protein [Mesobacterium pallidum]|uniref:PQQ-like beta-propeller repeat protein n=1 Tax=Mesobacterium pallidum TaxID=2872037 RepID=UPI001EE3980D